MRRQKKIMMGCAVTGLAVCVITGVGLFTSNHKNKSIQDKENQVVSDEVAEIENLNSKDNVVDAEDLFEGEKASWKEKQELKKEASKQSGASSSNNQASGQNVQSSKPEKQPSKPDEQPSNPDEQPSKPDEQPSNPDEQPSKPDEQPSKPDEQPSIPDEEPSKPALPQVNEPGWITGIY